LALETGADPGGGISDGPDFAVTFDLTWYTELHRSCERPDDQQRPFQD